MTQSNVLYAECPLCIESEIVWSEAAAVYRCGRCGLSIKDKTFLKFFNKGRYSVADFGTGHYALARQSLSQVALRPDSLKIAIGNVYPDEALAAIAAGDLARLRPVRTVLAQIILEQLNEECFIQVTGLRRGHGRPLADEAAYLPTAAVPRSGMTWHDEGNLFCTTHRLVFPSDRFTFIRLDRKIVGVKAFTDGVAVQRKGEEFATYFVGCYPHEAALVAAYVLAKVPKLQKMREKLDQ